MKSIIFTLIAIVALITLETDARFSDASKEGGKTIESQEQGYRRRQTQNAASNEQKAQLVAASVAKSCSIYDPECSKKAASTARGTAPIVTGKGMTPLPLASQVDTVPRASKNDVLQGIGNVMGQVFQGVVEPHQLQSTREQQETRLQLPRKRSQFYNHNPNMLTKPTQLTNIFHFFGP